MLLEDLDIVSIPSAWRYCDKPAPPEPVLLIDSPPAESAALPGTGDGAADVFDTPTFLI